MKEVEASKRPFGSATLGAVYPGRAPWLLLAVVALLCAPLTACCSADETADSTAAGARKPAGHPISEDPSETPEEESTAAAATAVATAPAFPEGSPQAALAAYIRAQEEADWAGAADVLTEAAQDDFNDATEDMDEDDLVEAGLRMRQEDYKLDTSDDTTAIFFSRKAGLYLVMTREDERWKVNPTRTDQMNLAGE